VNDFEDEPALLGKAWLYTAFEVAERNGTLKHWKTMALDCPSLKKLREAAGL
jgi:hypothetical protein